MISKLSEVLDNYSVTDKTHGTVKFGPRDPKISTKNIAYVMLAAAGDAVKDLTEPHITIWGCNARTDSWISSVEFSWAGARHVYFNLKSQSFSTPHIPTSDLPVASRLQLLLELFLNTAGIATITSTATSSTSSSTSTSNSNSNNNNSNGVSMPGSASYATDFPPMGASMGKK